MASVGLLLCCVAVAGLFYLDRDKSVRTSKGLWVPVLWFWIIGSRPVSEWWSGGRTIQTLSQQLDGSPTDRAFFFLVLLMGIVVLFRRRARAATLLSGNGPIFIYFAYCLVSVIWSPFPDVALKRWSKAIGDLVMAFVVVTDINPIGALKRLLTRTAFLLLPFSVYLTKYSEMGRGYTPDGAPMNTGVTTNKNTLGVVTLVLLLGAFWRFVTVFREADENRRRLLLSQGGILAIGVVVLLQSDSATSLACFGLGSMLILMTSFKAIQRRPASVHVMLAVAALGAVALVFGDQSAAAGALGRDTTLTGRTDIWKAVIPAVPNALLGAGFESFWIAPDTKPAMERSGLSEYMAGVNSAHNGFIEVYANLGWIGVGLIVLVLAGAYRRACAAFRRSPQVAGLLLAYVVVAPAYGVTEAGFRMLGPLWIFLVLAAVFGSHIAAADSAAPAGAERPGPTRPPEAVVARPRSRGYGPLPVTRSAAAHAAVNVRTIPRTAGRNR